MSDYSNTTSLRSNFVKERTNITYMGARRQSEILNEMDDEEKKAAMTGEPEVPMSSTPEQVIHYFEEIIAETSDRQKIHIYSQAIHWIKENEERKREDIAEKVRAFNARHSADDEEPEDIDLKGVMAE